MIRSGAILEGRAVADLGDIEAAAAVGLARAVFRLPGESVEPACPVVAVQHPHKTASA